MKHTGLMLPHKFQTLGWIIVAIPFILYGILLLSHLFCTESQLIHLGERYSRILVMILFLCVPIGGAILCFSEEKEEDEMIKNIRLRAIGLMAAGELLLCTFLFTFWGLNSILDFYTPDYSDITVWPYIHLGHIIFCIQFPIYFLLFKLLLFINKVRNEE